LGSSFLNGGFVPNSNSAVVRPTTRRRVTNNVRRLTNQVAAVIASAVRAASPRTAKLDMVDRAQLFESLEDRTLMSVARDGAGFTVVTPSGGDRVIYCSASGNDSNSGLSPSSPIRSVGRGVNMLRSGTGDQLLLKRGDSFSGTLGFWTKSGRDSSSPIVVGTYGSGPRPVVNTGASYAMSSGMTSGIHDIDILGIKFVSNGTAVADGISMCGKVNNLLIEDCEITKYVNNIVLQKFFGPVTNVTVRRSVITDSMSRAGRNSEGLFAEAVNNLTLEENTFDHNGWGGGHPATVFNHNAYIRSTCTGFVAIGNIFSNASSHGLQARAGGIIESNVFLNNATGLSFGLSNGSFVTPGGVSGRVTNNVFMGMHNIGSQIRGVAMEIGNIRRGGTSISGNIIANGNANSKLPAIQLAVGTNDTNLAQAVGINDLTLSNNVVYNYSMGFWVVAGQAPGSGYKALNNLNVVNNQFQRIATPAAIVRGSPAGNYGNNAVFTLQTNRYYTNPGGTWSQVGYSDPGRTPGTMVGGSYDTFVSLARGQDKSDWNTRFTAATAVAYVKGGFNQGSMRSIPLPPPPPPVSTSTTTSKTPTSTTSTPITPTTASFTRAWIDFGPVGTALNAGGFHADTGTAFSNHGAFSYGWNVNSTDAAQDKNKNADPLFDGSIGFKSGAKWEIAVPNGTYQVMLAIGDAAVATTNTLHVEGVAAAVGLKVAANKFVNKTVLATVRDGRLTIDANGSAGLSTRINYLKITKV
jgi:hypothetical protein